MEIRASKAGFALKSALWLAQAIVSAMFLMGSFMKLGVPREELAKVMVWTTEAHPAFVTFTGIVDGLGGLGIILPSLTRIKPELTVLAAKGCLLLQICAFGFHVWRGEGASLAPMNVVLGLLAAFVIWGRSGPAAISAR